MKITLKSISLIFLLLSLVYISFISFYTFFQPLRTDDTFWHLKIGEIIFKTGSFPEADPLLFTSRGLKPLYHEWLFQVGIFLFSKIKGLYFLRFVLPLMAGLIVIKIFKFFSLFLSTKQELIAGISIFLLFSYQRLIQLRPHIFSIFLFYWFLHLILKKEDNHFFKRVLIFIVLSIIWANMHSLCLIIFPYWFLFIIMSLVYREQFNISFKNIVNQLQYITISFFAMALNPLGIKIYAFFFIGSARNDYKNVIDEWGRFNPFGLNDFLPLSSFVLVIWFFFIAVFTYLALTHKWFKISFKKNVKRDNGYLEFLKFYIYAAAGLSIAIIFYAVRFVWLIPFPFLAIIIFLKEELKCQQEFKELLKVLLAVLLCVSAYIHFNLKDSKMYRIPFNNTYFVNAVDSIKYHEQAVTFLKDKQIKGLIFNPYFMGGFLSFYLYPDIKTFIDGRFEHYSAKVNHDYYFIRQAGDDFEDLLDEYRIDIFFIPLYKQYSKLRAILPKFDYRLVYKDYSTEIFIRKNMQL